MTNGGYIKINRKIGNWEWYTDIKTFKLYLHLLLFANWEEASFLGVTVGRGQIARSIASLSQETGLTRDEVRVAIAHLEKSGDITKSSRGKFTLFTVVNYDDEQGEAQAFPKQIPNVSQTNPKHFPTIEEIKNNKNKNNNKEYELEPSFDPNEFFNIAVSHARMRAGRGFDEN